jgi:hypothetical protein
LSEIAGIPLPSGMGKDRRSPVERGPCSAEIGWITIPKMSGRISAVVHRVTSGKLRSITPTKTRTGLKLTDVRNAFFIYARPARAATSQW